MSEMGAFATGSSQQQPGQVRYVGESDIRDLTALRFMRG
jgi:hypothetical protein